MVECIYEYKTRMPARKYVNMYLILEYILFSLTACLVVFINTLFPGSTKKLRENVENTAFIASPKTR